MEPNPHPSLLELAQDSERGLDFAFEHANTEAWPVFEWSTDGGALLRIGSSAAGGLMEDLQMARGCSLSG